MPNLQHWDEIEAEQRGPLVRKRAIVGSAATLVQLIIEAGATADRHSHPFEQFVHVVSGGGTLQTEEGTRAFKAGSVFHFAPGAWHAAVFDEDTILVETNLM